MRKGQIIFYVRSEKTFETQTFDVQKATLMRRGGIGRYGTDQSTYSMSYRDTVTEAKAEFILPENQKKTVELVTKIAAKRGLDVKIADRAKENALRRIIEREPEIKVFPTLIVSSGERIEGEMTKEQIESLLSRSQ